ncbi:hypothetical protein OSB04_007141 [Centaurea solstitialis]|uniref:Uncharacterized protein n=1 Tax=Centaurea solstitialis TaxID=347529 RepID=A0AA38WT46_9ASTR|nr:hypothetical protein OSB04_007141 [Centaurea solstitialis]
MRKIFDLGLHLSTTYEQLSVHHSSTTSSTFNFRPDSITRFGFERRVDFSSLRLKKGDDVWRKVKGYSRGERGKRYKIGNEEITLMCSACDRLKRQEIDGPKGRRVIWPKEESSRENRSRMPLLRPSSGLFSASLRLFRISSNRMRRAHSPYHTHCLYVFFIIPSFLHNSFLPIITLIN